jgi:hypothetical protein
MIESISETPFTGLGKPEPLSMNLQEHGREESAKNTALFMKY